MKQRIFTFLTALGIVSLTLTSGVAMAYDPLKEGCNTTPKPAICNELDGTTGKAKVNKTVTNVINVLLYVLGIICVIMIIVGGIKYTTSNGDSSAINSAKNTILYAVVGLVVAIMAFAIVNFVINRI
jgi:hypothetical protein